MSIFGSLPFTALKREFVYSSHAINLSPSPPDTGRYIVASRFRCQPFGYGIHC